MVVEGMGMVVEEVLDVLGVGVVDGGGIIVVEEPVGGVGYGMVVVGGAGGIGVDGGVILLDPLAGGGVGTGTETGGIFGVVGGGLKMFVGKVVVELVAEDSVTDVVVDVDSVTEVVDSSVVDVEVVAGVIILFPTYIAKSRIDKINAISTTIFFFPTSTTY